MSPSRTSHFVQEQFGASFRDLLMRQRITAAKALLTETDLTIQEIAEQAGFSTSPYFCRAFRAQTGSSPGAYRQQNCHIPLR